MSIKEEMKRFCKEMGIDYVGVSSIDRLANLPAGHRPGDLLPGAKSVIVMGIRLPQAVIEVHKRVFNGEAARHHYFSYSRYGYRKINEDLDTAALHLVDYIEKKYEKTAYPIPSSEPLDEELQMAAMSNRYAAVCAGLGQMGWSGLVITPKHGPRVRWISVITQLELEADPLYKEKLCDPSKCQVCVNVCPVSALSSEERVDVQINDYKTSYAKRNKPLCRCAVNGLVKGTPGRLQADVPEKMETMDDWYNFTKKDDPWQRMEFNHGNYCQRCMIECPVGAK